MATELTHEMLPLEMERLKTSIKYHEWILGVIIVVMLTQFAYLIKAMDTLKDGLTDVRISIEVMQRDIEVMKQDIEVMKQDIEVMKQDIEVMKQDIEVMKQDIEALQGKAEVMQGDINTLDRKMDKYHSNSEL